MNKIESPQKLNKSEHLKQSNASIDIFGFERLETSAYDKNDRIIPQTVFAMHALNILYDKNYRFSASGQFGIFSSIQKLNDQSSNVR